MNRAIRLFCGLVLSVLLAPSSAFSAPPKGAVKLPNSKVVKKDGFVCGNIRRDTWVPGRRIAGGYFYSYQAERTNLRGQLKGASKSKRAKLRAKIDGLSALIASRSEQCVAGGGSNGGGGGSSSPGRALKFDFSGAVGLTLNQSTGAALYSRQSYSPSNLKKVDDSGRQSDVVTSGSAMIGKLLIAPNDKLYVLFQLPTNLEDTSKSGLLRDGSTCLLAEISRTTGTPVCVDSTIDSIQWPEQSVSLGQASPAIQFDGQGALYYIGSSKGSTVLRRYLNGIATDLVTSNVGITNFFVNLDGSVIFSGTTSSSQSDWIRKVTTGGSLKTLKSLRRCNGRPSFFMNLFPDAKLYVGIECYGDSLEDFATGIYRLDPSQDSFESSPWMGYSCPSFMGSCDNPLPPPCST
jgi:hypothetical protein